jgi:hypothetical protein
VDSTSVVAKHERTRALLIDEDEAIQGYAY